MKFDNPKMTKAELERYVDLPEATLSRGDAKEQFDRAISTMVIMRDKDGRRISDSDSDSGFDSDLD